MKKIKTIKFTNTLLPALVALAAIGCTEERPYEEISKVNNNPEISKATTGLCAEEDVYMYLPSTVETSRTTAATRPHWMGSEKLVKLKCTRDFLQVVEIDTESDFADNPANSLPVLSIPIEHIDYKCKEDADGKCTQQEEENDDIHWSKKRFVQVDFAGLAVEEANTLPIQISKIFGDSCITAKGETVKESKIENDAINITVEKTFQSKLQCAGNISKLAELGFKVNYHYSLVKLDSLTTTGYKPLKYSRAEETTFGYFNTKSKKLDVDNNDTIFSEKTYLNRFAPSKNVTYHLSESFMKPENQKLIAHTKAAVDSINKSLQKAGATMQINIVDPVNNLKTGDLRINSIVLEDDPLAMNVIGYGPSATNPRTGEIVHARTVMYLGTIKKFIYRTYDEFVTKALIEKAAQDSGAVSGQVEASSEVMGMAAQALAMQSDMTTEKLTHALHSHDHSEHGHFVKQGFQARNLSSSKFVNEKVIQDAVTNPLNHRLSTRDMLYKKFENQEHQGHVHDDFLLSKNCMYTSDMLAPITTSVEDDIEKLVKQLGNKPWIQLTSEQKALVVDTVLPFYWVPVLVHEIGHNLGLRHNFAGSEDKDNFYTEKELQDMGIDRAISYSSVMDYTYSTLNELPVMGKYDVAALMFAYAEKVEKADGNIVSLEDYRKTGGQLKPYKFCTDEHVSVNPNCNRFDEGTNLTEIAQHQVKAYEESYARNNFRNLKSNFSLYDDFTYIRRLQRTLGSLRTVFERYEGIKNDFGLAADHPIWESNAFLKDLKQAAIVAGKHMIKVLQTPDLMCAVSAKANPSQIVALVPIQQLSTRAASCFDSQNVNLNAQFMIVGQAGKLFQSKKDPRAGNPYMDQIDVRGIWIDKLYALDALVGRTIGISSFDKYQGNFMDLPEVAADLDKALKDILMDQTVTKVDIITAAGQKLTVDFPVKMFNKAEGQNGHRIIDPLHPYVGLVLGLPKGNPSFQQVVIKHLKEKLPSQQQIADPTSLLNAMTIGIADIKDLVSIPTPAQGVVSTVLGQSVYYAPLSNSVGANIIMMKDVVALLEEVGKEKVQALAEKKAKGEQLDEKASDKDKQVFALPETILTAFVGDRIPSKEFFEMSLLANN